MLIELWESKIKEGKTDEAIAVYTDWAEAINKREQTANARVLRPETGDLYRVGMIVEFDSLAAREAFYKGFLPPDEYREMVDRMESSTSNIAHQYYYAK